MEWEKGKDIYIFINTISRQVFFTYFHKFYPHQKETLPEEERAKSKHITVRRCDSYLQIWNHQSLTDSLTHWPLTHWLTGVGAGRCYCIYKTNPIYISVLGILFEMNVQIYFTWSTSTHWKIELRSELLHRKSSNATELWHIEKIPASQRHIWIKTINPRMF